MSDNDTACESEASEKTEHGSSTVTGEVSDQQVKNERTKGEKNCRNLVMISLCLFTVGFGQVFLQNKSVSGFFFVQTLSIFLSYTTKGRFCN